MSAATPPAADVQVEQWLGRLLQIGVLLAASVVLVGGLLYLTQHGDEPADRTEFQGEPERLRHPSEIIAGALAWRSRALIQLGLLLLIATPVARVVFSVLAFGRQRDYLYVVFTLVVLAVLLYSLFWGHWPD